MRRVRVMLIAATLGAIGSLTTTINASFGSKEAFVSQASAAIARVDSLASTWVMRQKAGAATGVVEAVAFTSPANAATVRGVAKVLEIQPSQFQTETRPDIGAFHGRRASCRKPARTRQQWMLCQGQSSRATRGGFEAHLGRTEAFCF